MNQQYEYTPLYYGTPCQVRFYDAYDDVWCGGVAYHDFIICGCCGAIISIQDIIDGAADVSVHWDDAIIELEWLDISNEIMGDI